MITAIILIIFIFYYIFIPISVSLPLLLIIDINFSVFLPIVYSSLVVNSIIFYAYILIKVINDVNNFKNNNSIIKKIFIYYSPIILVVMFITEILVDCKLCFIEVIGGKYMAFLMMIISYIDIYNLKYKNIKQTLKNLSKKFYLFMLLTSSLFGFKYYLFINNIKSPSFYFLFLTIPISVLIVYLYVKDLGPIIRELKEVNKDSEIKLEETNGENK